MSRLLVNAQGINVFYRLYSQRCWTLKERLLSGFKKRHEYTNFHALKSFSLSVTPGEAIALVGPNGAGKSTLLKVLSRVLKPAWGSLAVNGRLAALIELGAGFEPELTGRENLYFGGSILGYSKKEMDGMVDAIIDFSELGQFIDEPFRSFSSGMQARLGYALAALSAPDLLVVDEVLAVGDESFQQKCLAHMKKFLKKGGTLLFVSHDHRLIQEVCQRVITIENGIKVSDEAVSRPQVRGFEPTL